MPPRKAHTPAPLVAAKPYAPRAQRKDAGQPRGTRPRKQQMSAASLANLRKGNTPAPSATPPAVQPTATTAAEYVRIRAAGLPCEEAVAFFLPPGTRKLSAAALKALGGEWEISAPVAAAWDAFHGGKWQELSADTRLGIAIDHHLAQLAYYLYTSDFTDPLANTKKIGEARDAILAKLESDKGGDDSRFNAFMRALIDGKSKGASTPSLDGPPVYVEPPDREM